MRFMRPPGSVALPRWQERSRSSAPGVTPALQRRFGVLAALADTGLGPDLFGSQVNTAGDGERSPEMRQCLHVVTVGEQQLTGAVQHLSLTMSDPKVGIQIKCLVQAGLGLRVLASRELYSADDVP